MEGSAFKRVTQFLTVDGSRRGMLRTATSSVAASALAGIGLASRADDEVEAKNKKKKKRCKPQPLLSACQDNKDCCCQTNRICSTPCGVDQPGTVPLVCCGVKGASCTVTGECCFGFICNPVTGVCEEGPC
jgi:hypothetical protein